MANTTVAGQQYDCLIVGGGPAGLSAAIYAAREGMHALVLDKAACGGMAAITESIANYPGFSKGVGGQQLVDEMVDQAKEFGAEIIEFTEVQKIETAGVSRSGTSLAATWNVVCDDGAVYNTKALLIATGSEYRKLGVPGEAELIGRGVHFCATCDGPLYKDKEIIVIGGGNSAMQESLFLARFASKVTILVRTAEFTGSDILKQQVKDEPRITAQYNIQTDALDREAPGKPIVVSYTSEDQKKTIQAAGVFVFVGLLPNTHGLANVQEDEKGFIVSDLTYQTHLPGVFVAGDVRSGSTWQIASAVGEGVSAALSIRQYLDKVFAGWHKSA